MTDVQLSRRGAVAMVVGDAGIGKSSLVESLAGTNSESVLWLYARSSPNGAQLSFHPFIDAIREWLGLGSRDDDVTACRSALDLAVSSLFGDETARMLPLLASLLGLELSDGERTYLAQIDHSGRSTLSFWAMTELLRRISERQPLVLAVEDLHWADESSIELLESLLKRVDDAAILFVITMRTGHPELEQRVSVMVDDRGTSRGVRIELKPLERDKVRELLSVLVGGERLTVNLRETIEQVTGGNPFFIGEVIRSLVEEGSLEDRGGTLHLMDPDRAIVIPKTAQEVIENRISRLGQSARQILEYAAVIGRRVDRRILSALAQVDHLDDLIGELQSRTLLRPRRRGRVREFSFHHPIVEESIYRAIDLERRVGMHLDVAKFIESDLPSSTPGYLGMLAYHFGIAGDLAKADKYLLLAGEAAIENAASAEALFYFRNAARSFRERPHAVESGMLAILEERIAFVCFRRGDFIEANEHFTRSLEIRGERVVRGIVAERLHLFTGLCQVMARIYLGWNRPRPFANPRQRELIEMLILRARVQTSAATDRFLFDSIEALSRLNRVDPMSVSGPGGAYASAMGIFSFGGLSFSIGHRFLDIASNLVDAKDPHEWLFYRMMNFCHHVLAGNWNSEHTLGRDLVQDGVGRGQFWEVVTCLGYEADQYIYQGRYADAQSVIDQISKIETHYDYRLARSNRQYVTALLALHRFRLDEAAEEIDAYYMDHDEPALHLLALGMKAELHILQGEFELARECLRLGATEAKLAFPVPPVQISGLWRSALQLEIADTREAKNRGLKVAVWRRLLTAERLSWTARWGARWVAWERPPVYREMGNLRLLQGRGASAFKWWRRALEAARSLGMQKEVAQVRLAAAGAMKVVRRVDRFDGMTEDELVEKAKMTLGRLGVELRS